MSASLPFCCLNKAILAAVRRCRSATVLQSIHVQSLKRHWCLWPRRSDKMPWFLQRVHFGLRFDAVAFRSAELLSLSSSLTSCWCISCLFHRQKLWSTWSVVRTARWFLKQRARLKFALTWIGFLHTQGISRRARIATLYCSKILHLSAIDWLAIKFKELWDAIYPTEQRKQREER